MKMMSAGKPDLPEGFALKQDPGRSTNQESDEDATTSFEDINNLLSMPIPSLSKKFLVPNDPNDEFLRLTTMVRAVYVSYLHKCLLSNYIFCYKEKNKEIPCMQLKKCADELELNAVRYSLEASLYRQHMLKLISDIKSHTSEKKPYKKLLIHLESPSDKIDAAVQTDNSWAELERLDNIQSVCITSNCEELSSVKQGSHWSDDDDTVQIDNLNATSPHSTGNQTASPTVNSTSFFEVDHGKFNESDEEVNIAPPKETVRNTQVQEVTIKQNSNTCPIVQDNPNASLANDTSIRNEDENSQDSILQHMEDMFCESDDSSDLTTLIERHSGISKANIDKEINKMCQEAESFLSQNSNNDNRTPCSNNVKPDATKANNLTKPPSTAPNKFSFSYYKEMKSRGMTNPLPPEPETAEIKQKRRTNSVWFVERVHQVSKLKAKMTELSLKNYRKYGRVKEKFIELFGESDDEEMMPDSPICIEEHLTACKERIAPWIVKHLMPLYKKRRIKDRQLFKAVAKHIADMLILENTFPEQDCVSKYIEKYFRNKKIIKTKQDIYL